MVGHDDVSPYTVKRFVLPKFAQQAMCVFVIENGLPAVCADRDKLNNRAIRTLQSGQVHRTFALRQIHRAKFIKMKGV